MKILCEKVKLLKRGMKMSLEIKTGFNELKVTPELGTMAGSTRCCASGTCNSVAFTLDAASKISFEGSKFESINKALSL